MSKDKVKNEEIKNEEIKNEELKDNEVKKEEVVIDYKKLYEESLQKIVDLEIKLFQTKAENDKNISDFQEKAKGFASKAQEEVNRIRQELHNKAEEDNKEVKKYGSQKLLESIIDPLINIELAVKAGKNNEAVSAYVIGFEMLLNQLYSELESFGVSRIVPEVNQEFDPLLHFALSTKEGKTNVILEVKKNGLKLHDRVIKPATVIIGK